MKILTVTPHKPIIYPPGIISLVLLPVFCLVFLNQHKAFVRQGAMDVTMWPPYGIKNLPKKYQVKFPPDRNYLAINLNGTDADDKVRLDYARLEVKKMLSDKDTAKGVNFHFGNHTKYWTYVNAIDICQTEGVQTYGITQDDIYALYVKPEIYDKPQYTFICGMGYRNQEMRNREKREERLQAINKKIKDYWPLGIPFLIMSFFAIRKLFLNLG
jgi:ribosomal protein S26